MIRWGKRVALSIALLLLSGAASAQQQASLPTEQEIADFWDTVFNGAAPYGVPALNPTRSNQRTVNNCTVWDVTFDSYKDPATNTPVRLGGFFAIPNNIPAPGPGGTYPGLVANHSTGGGGIVGEAAAVFFAQKGFAAMWFSYRTETWSPIPSGSYDYFVDNLAGPTGQPLNYLWTGMAVDTYQAGEFMAAQPEVWDPNGLTFIGHSGGGYTALAAGVFSTRFQKISASAPAGAWPDAGEWLDYVWGNGGFLSIQTWINSQGDPAYARSLVERSLTFISMAKAIDNPSLIAKNPDWKLDGTAIWIYGGQMDAAIPAWSAEAAYEISDPSTPLLKAFHWSPTGAHGGPESWNRAQAWIAGHYPNITTTPPVAALAVSANSDPTFTFSAAGSQAWRYDWSYDGGSMVTNNDDIVAWDYDFGDGTSKNWGATVTHTYASSGTYTVKVTITDGAGLRDSATVSVTVATGAGSNAQLSVSAGNPVVVPEGGTTPFQVMLTDPPAGNVTVTVAAVSGDTDLSVQSGATLFFTPLNWNVLQVVTLAAAQDADASSDTAVFAVSSSGMPAVNVNVKESDDEAAYTITVGSASGAPGDTVSVAVTLSNPDGGVVQSISFSLNFDGAVLTSPVVSRGPAIPDLAFWNFSSTSPSADVLDITMNEFVPTDPLVTIDGVIVTVSFTIGSGAAAGVYPVDVTTATVNTATPTLQNGAVTAGGTDTAPPSVALDTVGVTGTIDDPTITQVVVSGVGTVSVISGGFSFDWPVSGSGFQVSADDGTNVTMRQIDVTVAP